MLHDTLRRPITLECLSSTYAPPSITERPRLSPRVAIEHAVTLVFGVLSTDLNAPRRGKAQIALARQTAMYLAHVGFSLSFTEVGLLFERDRTTVAHACALIEDRRDDTSFDRAIELLERAVKAMQLAGITIPRRNDPMPRSACSSST